MSLPQVADRPRFAFVSPRLIICALFGLLLMGPKLYAYLTIGTVLLEDDSYYYTMIAANIAETGRSTFDRQTLTNGYHPLWMAAMVLQHLVIGSSAITTISIEAMLCTAALWLLLGCVEHWSLQARAIFAACLLGPLAKLALTGMEVSLILFCFATLLATLWSEAADRRWRWLALGCAGALCIGARLDMAAFVLPLVALATKDRREALAALGVIGILGGLYCALNLAIFGVPLPISGSIKSLGGLQFNHLLADQLLRNGGSGALQLFAMFAGAGVALAVAPHGSVTRALLASLLLGLVIFWSKLLFSSSWVVWSWYWYPQILVVIGVLLAFLPVFAPRIDSLGPTSKQLLTVACLLIAVPSALRHPIDPQFVGLRQIDDLAVRRLMEISPGARIALGDRAGHFAHLYPGSVVQLEGIVNDKAYLEVVKGQGDLRGLLCARDVQLLVEWNRDLADYSTHSFTIFHPALTAFRGPAIDVSKSDEVARIRNAKVFAPGNGIDTIYVWRLRGCPNKSP